MKSVDAKITTTLWRSDALPRACQRQTALEEELAESHIPWAIYPEQDNDLHFEMERSHFLDLDLLRVRCGALRGFRAEQQLAATSDAYVGVLLVDAGLEKFDLDGSEVWMEPGKLVMWDSSMPMRFEVPPGRMNKLTLFVRHQTLSSYFPQFMKFIGKPLDATRGSGAIFASHLMTMEREIRHLARASAPRLLQGTLETLAFAFQDVELQGEATGGRRVLARVILDYVERNLSNADLGPASIAEAHRISTRYLHMLFNEEGLSISKTILQRRLMRCKADLSAPALKHLSISDIAFEWGFQDASYFTRAFRREFGMSPREFRYEASAGTSIAAATG
ncbi:MAG TPA: helix-turn-helix domain-containing protein [Steroidobacter sp.]